MKFHFFFSIFSILFTAQDQFSVDLINLLFHRNLYNPQVLGVDIDRSLISKAWTYYAKEKKNLHFKAVNFMEGFDAEKFLDAGDSQKDGKDGQADSSTKVTKDDTDKKKEDISNIPTHFDLIFAFSITKWIHYQYHDAGVKYFLKKITSKLNPKGYFILEPQPWKSYKKKNHLTEEIKKTVAGIKFHPGQFQKFLIEECGMEFVKKLTPEGDLGNQGFDREILLFRKK